MAESKVFTPELDEQLIVFVRDNPVLYDFNDSSYKNLITKDEVWRMISANLGKSVDECKMRWRTIRDSYKKNRKKIANAKGGSPVFPKSKYLTKNLQFLDHTFKELPCVSNYYDPAASSVSKGQSSNLQLLPDAGTDSEEDNIEMVTVKEEVLEINSGSEPDEPVEKMQTMMSSSCKTMEQVRLMGRLRPDQAEAVDSLRRTLSGFKDQIRNRIRETSEVDTRPEEVTSKTMEPRGGKRKILHKEMSSPGATTSVVQTEHPLDIFFRSMAETVKTFPKNLAAETRMEVCRVVTEMELRAILEDESDEDPLKPNTKSMKKS